MKDTLAKLQAMQKCDNNALQVYLYGRLLVHFYRATALQREVTQWIRAGMACKKPVKSSNFNKITHKGIEKSILFFRVQKKKRYKKNADEGCELYEDLFNRNITLVFLKEPHINTEVYKQALQNQIEIKLNTDNKAAEQ